MEEVLQGEQKFYQSKIFVWTFIIILLILLVFLGYLFFSFYTYVQEGSSSDVLEDYNVSQSAVIDPRDNCMVSFFSSSCSAYFSKPDIMEYCAKQKGVSKDKCYLYVSRNTGSSNTCDFISDSDLRAECQLFSLNSGGQHDS